MKRRSSLVSLLLIIVLASSAQVPQKFNYQAVVRDGQHDVIKNQDVAFRLSILAGSTDGPSIYVETHTLSTSAVGLANMEIGDGTVQSGVFKDIDWGSDDYFLEVEADPAGGTSFEYLGTSQLISVPYALYSGNISSPTKKFTIQEEMGHPVDSALFEVRNREGQTVFAVYPEGTRIFVLDENGKGVRGGFAVGGYSRNTKGVTQEYMRVTPDSIRMYFDEKGSKGVRGGFAVGGYSRNTKGVTDHYFMLKPDSAKFTMISENADVASNAISIITKSKTGSPDEIDGLNLFNLTRDNYFIGHRAGENITDGAGNCFFGYEAGKNNTSGYGNIFIGELSGSDNTDGSFNSFIGYKAGMWNTSGISNVSIGFGAGQRNLVGNNNVSVGTDAGHFATGNHNVFMGAGAGINNKWGNNNIMIGSGAGSESDSSLANIFIGSPSGFNNTGGVANVFLGNSTGFENEHGSNNTFIGHGAGQNNVDGNLNVFFGAYTGHNNVNGNSNTFIGMDAGSNHVEGDENVYIGTDAGFSNTTGNSNVYIGTRAGANNTDGKENIFIGFEAGQNAPGSGKLYIDLYGNNPDQALIYGDLYDRKLQVNHQLGVGRLPINNALEVDGDVSKSSAGEWLVNSDARIKTEVLEINNAIEIISRLRPVTFRYTDEWMTMNPGVKDRVYYNYIAQEYKEVFPQSVQKGGGSLEGDEDPLLQLDSHPANIVAIKAIQELAEQNKKLNDQYGEQQTILDQLQKENEALRQMNQEILDLIAKLQYPDNIHITKK